MIHSRLSSISRLGLQRFTQLKKLCLRQNFISTLDGGDFDALKELEELDFYDNKIKDVGDALDSCKKLTLVFLSGLETPS